jgi:hypothetical protein
MYTNGIDHFIKTYSENHNVIVDSFYNVNNVNNDNSDSGINNISNRVVFMTKFFMHVGIGALIGFISISIALLIIKIEFLWRVFKISLSVAEVLILFLLILYGGLKYLPHALLYFMITRYNKTIRTYKTIKGKINKMM